MWWAGMPLHLGDAESSKAGAARLGTARATGSWSTRSRWRA